MLRICWKTGLVHEDQGLHGLESDLRDFAEGGTQVLICTGAASRRRLDFQASHVVIFELPSDIDTFVYLVGRAGAGHCAAQGPEQKAAVEKEIERRRRVAAGSGRGRA